MKKLHPAAIPFVLMLGILMMSGENLHAQAGGQVRIDFKNTSTRKLTLNSAAPGQPMRVMGEVNPGQTTTVQSLPGQNWVLLNPNNRVFGEYRASNQARQVYTITQEGGFAGNAPVPAPAPAPGNNKPGPAATGQTGSNLTPEQAQQMLVYHNQRRAEVGTNKVTWSPKLAQFAQERANTIARTRKLAHLPQGQNPYGENLAQGGASGGVSGFTVLNACEGWYAERAKLPKNARTMTVDLFNRGVGHYTQMVWKDTTQIGAGVASYQQGNFTMTVIVCCYNPPGNFIGGPIY